MPTKSQVRKFLPEISIFSFALITRFFRLSTPPKYYFDEVYHAFTASQMFKGNPAAWEWWNPNPPGVAYEWTHPPVAKEFMVLAIAIFGDNSFAWRFFSALLGFGVIILIYILALKLFKSRRIALISAFVASLDGLLLTMSRIGMNDMYFLFFAMLAFVLFLYNKKILMGIALGLALASKWTGLFGIGIIGIIYLVQNLLLFKNKKIKPQKLFIRLLISPIFFLMIPLFIYLGAYLPFFTGHHVPPGTRQTTFQTFIELQQEMYWYHTNLKAHHTYQSVPIQWVFDLRPVWLYVDYQPNSIANIYTLGNPIFMWFGVISIVFLIYEFIKKKSMSLWIVVISYFGFFLPWIESPRIMFHYHYLPSVPFLAIAIGYTVNEMLKNPTAKVLAIIFLITLSLVFVYFFPLWTAIHVPFALYNSYFWLPSWK